MEDIDASFIQTDDVEPPQSSFLQISSSITHKHNIIQEKSSEKEIIVESMLVGNQEGENLEEGEGQSLQEESQASEQEEEEQYEEMEPMSEPKDSKDIFIQ